MSEEKDVRVEDLSAEASAKAEGRAAHGTTCQAGGRVALPEQKAFFSAKADPPLEERFRLVTMELSSEGGRGSDTCRFSNGLNRLVSDDGRR